MKAKTNQVCKEMILAFILCLLCCKCQITIGATCNDNVTVIPIPAEGSIVDHYPYRYMLSTNVSKSTQGGQKCLDIFKGQSLMTLRNEFEYNNLLELIHGKYSFL